MGDLTASMISTEDYKNILLKIQKLTTGQNINSVCGEVGPKWDICITPNTPRLKEHSRKESRKFVRARGQENTG